MNLLSKARSPRVLSLATWGIAFVWLFQGLFAKVLDLMPRHRMIVARLVGADASKLTIVLIGIAEILIALWIVSRVTPRTCALVQTIALAIMNAYELTHAPDLLLIGYAHVFLTIGFLIVVWTVAELSHRARQVAVRARGPTS